MPSEERTNTPIGIFMAIAFSALQYENRVPTFDLYNGIQNGLSWVSVICQWIGLKAARSPCAWNVEGA